jgi:hypothetical protein
MSDVEALLAKAKVCVSPTTSGRPRFQTKHLQALARGVDSLTRLHANVHACVHLRVHARWHMCAHTHALRTHTHCPSIQVPVVTTEKGSLGYHVPLNTSTAQPHRSCQSEANGSCDVVAAVAVVAVNCCVCVSVAISMSVVTHGPFIYLFIS